MKEAQKEIIAVTPYPNFTPETIALLQDGLKADPERRLIVVTNSVMTSDNMPAQVSVDQNVGALFGNTPQSKVYEYGQLDATQLGGKTPYPKVHAKYFIFDRKTVVGGTFNLDDRSDFLNIEDMLAMTPVNPSSQFMQNYLNQVNAWISQSYVVGTPEWNQLRTNHKLGVVKNLVVKQETTLQMILKVFHLEWMV